jgi:hypothetical protein
MAQTGRIRMKFLDPNHPFFARVWVRWATVLLPLAWAVVEFMLNDPGWGILFFAAGAYAFYMLIVKGPDQP